MNLIEKRKKAAGLLDECDVLAAKQKAGCLTSEEGQRFDSLILEVQVLQAEINPERRALGYDSLKAWSNESSNHPFRPSPGGAGGDTEYESIGEFRVLRPNQRLADLAEKPDATGRRLSLGKMVRGVVLGNWKGADEERAAMGETGGAGGGFLVPDSLSSTVIDLARNQSYCIQAGVKTLPMETAEVDIGRVVNDPTAYWVPEHGPITESGMLFERLSLVAMTLGALCRVSVQLLEDSPTISSTLDNALGKALGLQVDRVILLGAGTAEPRGLLHTTGVQEYSMGENGLALSSYDPFSFAVEAIANFNSLANSVIYSPRTAGALDRLKETTTGQPLKPPASFENLKKFSTNQIGNAMIHGTAPAASAAFVGDFTQALLGVRTELMIEASRTAGTSFSSMEVLVRAYLRCDVAVLRPSSFCIVKGIV